VTAPAARRLGIPTAAVLVAALVAVILLVGGNDRPRALPPARAVDARACSQITYAGEGNPSALVLLTGPLQGTWRVHGFQAVQAVKLVLASRDWRAGAHTVGLQVCSEVSHGSDESDPVRCLRIAHALAPNRAVLGVIGPWSSTCASMLAVLNRAPGPLAVVSPSATYLGLTRPGPGAAPGDPERYRPSGRRNFARVVPADDVQAAAGVEYARQLGAQRLFVLHDQTAYGRGLAAAVRASAPLAKLRVAGKSAWRPSAHNYHALAGRVRRAHADAVYLAGLLDSNGPRLIVDLRSALGARLPILGPDGFSDPGYLIEHAGTAAEGFVYTTATLPGRTLPPAGQRFAIEFKRRFGNLPCCIAVPSAQAMDILLDAIAASDGSRAAVTRNVLHAKVTDGLLGSFGFDVAGDTTGNTIAVYRITDGRNRFQRPLVPPTAMLARH
jgi:branched-chain amino acid transport system substrate-binding protein